MDLVANLDCAYSLSFLPPYQPTLCPTFFHISFEPSTFLLTPLFSHFSHLYPTPFVAYQLVWLMVCWWLVYHTWHKSLACLLFLIFFLEVTTCIYHGDVFLDKVVYISWYYTTLRVLWIHYPLLVVQCLSLYDLIKKEEKKRKNRKTKRKR